MPSSGCGRVHWELYRWSAYPATHRHIPLCCELEPCIPLIWLSMSSLYGKHFSGHPDFCPALEAIDDTCFDHDSLHCRMITPRISSYSWKASWQSPKYKCIEDGVRFVGSNVTFHLSAQDFILSRSLLRLAATLLLSLGEGIVIGA